ncbi:MAG: acyl-CoA dehydratase activase-related protein [Promethearchaeota archaeon]
MEGKRRSVGKMEGRPPRHTRLAPPADESAPFASKKVERVRRKPKVGLPRALHFYRYYPFWKVLLEELGCEVVLSQTTNKKIVEEGVTMGFGELCLPVKVYYGHVLKLVRENPGLDFLFCPRYVSEWTDAYFCPKFISLPDVIKILPGVPPLLDFEVNVKEHPTSLAVVKLGKQLGVNEVTSLAAYRKAKDYFEEYHRYLQTGVPVNTALRLVERGREFKPIKKKGEKAIRLLLLGHGYNLFDNFVNLDFQKKLTKLGADFLTLENMPEDTFSKKVMVNGHLRNYWGHEEEILATVRYFLTKGKREIDGVIFLVSFACGPDSLMSELIMRDLKLVGTPYLLITMDEHTGEAGMLTRVESFVEMIKRKKWKGAGSGEETGVEPRRVELASSSLGA